MARTREIERADWEGFFDRFTREHVLADDVPKAVTVELVSPRRGDQVEASIARLLGLRYDPASHVLAVLLEDRDLVCPSPAEIRVMEDEEGFVAVLELVHADGSKDIIQVVRSGPPAIRHESLG